MTLLVLVLLFFQLDPLNLGNHRYRLLLVGQEVPFDPTTFFFQLSYIKKIISKIITINSETYSVCLAILSCYENTKLVLKNSLVVLGRHFYQQVQEFPVNRKYVNFKSLLI